MTTLGSTPEPRGKTAGMADQCQGPECERPAERDGLCRGHRQQKYEDKELTPLRAYRQDPWDRIFEAFIALLETDAEDDVAWKLARQRARKVLRSSHLTAAPRLPQSVVEAVRQARGNGDTLRAIAARFGVSHVAVLKLTRGNSPKVSGETDSVALD